MRYGADATSGESLAQVSVFGADQAAASTFAVDHMSSPVSEGSDPREVPNGAKTAGDEAPRRSLELSVQHADAGWV